MPPSRQNPPADDLDAVYARLRRIAQKLMSGERTAHTLSPTDVVHEAVGKLLSAGETLPRNASEFVEFVTHAARAMTEVLIDHSRTKNAIKRGRGRLKISLDGLADVEATMDEPDFDWSALNDAMDELMGFDARRYTVVLLRFFAGMDNRQIANLLEVDERTIGRDWSASRLWLKERLSEPS